MTKLGQMVTGRNRRMWLVKDMEILRTEGKETCYAVLGLYENGWAHLTNGSLAECRRYIERNM